MTSYEKDRGIIRELAKRYMEIAVSERHVRMRRRFRDSNDLKIVRPPLLLEEIPWHEMNLDGELDCVCEDAEMRKKEYGRKQDRKQTYSHFLFHMHSPRPFSVRSQRF